MVPLPALSEAFCKQLVVGSRSGRRHVPFDEPKSARLKGGGRWSAGPVDKLHIWKACQTTPTPKPFLGGGFKGFLFSPLLGEMVEFDC